MFILMATVVMLTGCRTQSALSAYDERPMNRQPVLERPSWPNYDLHDDRSFAVFSNVQTAPAKGGTLLRTEEGAIPTSGRYTLYRCQEATYLCFEWGVPDYQDWWFFRFTEGSAIIDADTGDRYLLQRLEHFPVNQCFWITGQSGETIRLVSVYPPLPPSVRRVQIYEASAPSRQWMDGTGFLSRVYDIDALRPIPEPVGRIIR